MKYKLWSQLRIYSQKTGGKKSKLMIFLIA